MISSSTFRSASVLVICRTAMVRLPEILSVLLKRCQPSARHSPTHPAGTGALKGLNVVSIVLVMLVAPSADADPPRPGRVGPEEAHLQFYFDCSEVASNRLLTLDEADSCSRVFMKIKLSFVPGVSLEDFDRLPPQEKFKINLGGYKRYRDWLSKNSIEVEAMKNATLPSAAVATN